MVGILTAFAGTVCGWWGVRVDSGKVQWAALSCFAGTVAVIAVAWSTVSPAEHAERTVSALVDAAVAGNPDRMLSLLTTEATLSHRNDASAPEGRSVIARRIEAITSDRIESNTVTLLQGTTITSSEATVELACLTTTSRSIGLIATRWNMELSKQPDGRWLITRIVWVNSP